MPEFTNELINSTSPYLLQHAHNPVEWKEWNEETLSLAVKEDKPILVSIGYSSCHWCHVMEKESFENVGIAKLMNANFINIKVDREERPDVDQIYMDAVQAMGLQGGWPLNVFLTPDQKPFYGGTYFPQKGWANLLVSIQEAFEKSRDKINESAEAFTKSLQAKESDKYKLKSTTHTFSESDAKQAYQTLASKFDSVDGGIKKSPKFPMPVVWKSLSNYAHIHNDQSALNHLRFTLEKIIDGGIYDHIGGGFARYSTDEEWHVPHFEKMLYDNGQLLSLYADGFKLTKSDKFKTTLLETIAWLKREMLDASGGFYSALDADSEGVEGKYYVWGMDEVQEIAKDDFDLIAKYYDIHAEGNWEGVNCLRVVQDENELANQFNLTIDHFNERIRAFKKAALEVREKRVRPGLDNKVIAGWNGLTLTGLVDAYQALNEPEILDLAHANAHFLKGLIKDGRLQRFPDKPLEGFMEDYAAVIQSFIKYYEITFDKSYLDLALTLMNRVNKGFYDESENLYYFSSDENSNLIARKKELFDNVIPSSNSIMAWNLIHLGTHFYNDELLNQGKSLLSQAKELAVQEPEYMSNWGATMLELSKDFAEIIIVGPEAKDFAQEINMKFLPNKIIAASQTEVDSEPFQAKTMIEGKTTIYVCFDKSCKKPVTSVQEAISQLG